MEINTPQELIVAINNLLAQMDRPTRKRFLMWVKTRRNLYDFNYPMGYKPETKGVKNEIGVQVASDSKCTVTPVVGESIPTVVASPESTDSIAIGEQCDSAFTSHVCTGQSDTPTSDEVTRAVIP